MRAERLKNEALKAASDGDWDTAIRKGSRVPASWDVWQQMPSVNPKTMPKEAVNKILDLLERTGKTEDSGFIYHVAHSPVYNMNLDTDTIHRLWMLAGPNNQMSRDALQGHPHFKITSHLHGPGHFWSDYEKKVFPDHFAAIEAWKKGKDVKLTDHRGQTGSSDRWIHVLPHMEEYAKASQKAILEDPNYEKKRSGSKVFVKLYRGVGGNYGKAIHNAFDFNHHTREADLGKKFIVPTAIFTSWTRDKDMAQLFAEGRGDIPGNVKDGGVVMQKWVPIENVLHTGEHDLYAGHPKVHREELEVVVHHPNKKMRVEGKDLFFPTNIKGDYGTVYDKGTDRGVKFEKGRMRDYAAALGVAAAMLGTSSPINMDQDKLSAEDIAQVRAAESHEPHPNLEAIKMVESSGGRNVAHEQVEHGLNAGTSAIGMYGIMPLQVQDTINHDHQLKHKYRNLLDYDPVVDQEKIRLYLTNNEKAQNEIANSHWKRLGDRFDGDEKRMAYAWKNGITGALHATDDEVNNHPYVKKYLSYKKMLEMEDKKQPLGKTEQELEHRIKNIRRFISVDPESANIGPMITEMIHGGQVHDLSNFGHFTHSSFIVGPDEDTSWLIKIEDHSSRPAIKSAQYGLQSVREAAFYEMARQVFGMGDYVPEAYLGEIQKRVPNTDRVEYVPAVAIKMLPKNFMLAAELEKKRPGAMEGVLEPYRKSGLVHKMAAMYAILGDADAHGKNMMTDGKHISLIDHGTSFADESFNPAEDSKVFIPYVLRAKRLKDGMTQDTKMSLLPTIKSPDVQKDVRNWIMSISEEGIRNVAGKYNVNPEPEIQRLRALKQAVLHQDPAVAINRFWVYGKF